MMLPFPNEDPRQPDQIIAGYAPDNPEFRAWLAGYRERRDAALRKGCLYAGTAAEFCNYCADCREDFS